MKVLVLCLRKSNTEKLKQLASGIDAVTFLNSILEVENHLTASKEVDFLIIEIGMLCNDSLVSFGDIIKSKLPNVEIIYHSDYILPYVKRKIVEKKYHYFDSSIKPEELSRKILNRNLLCTKSESAELKLTKSERQVLKYVAKGLKQAEIADELCVSPRTVNNHLANIYAKLNVNSTISAVVKGVQEGLVWIDYGISQG